MHPRLSIMSALLLVLCGCTEDSHDPAVCAGVDCSGHGTCLAKNNGEPQCICEPGFYPLQPLTCTRMEVDGGVLEDASIPDAGPTDSALADIADASVDAAPDALPDARPDAAGVDASTDLPCPPEICDGVDNDCDGVINEGCGTVCGEASSMTDNFDDGVTGAAWDWSYCGDPTQDAYCEETGGELVFSWVGVAQADVAYLTKPLYNLEGSYVLIEVTQYDPTNQGHLWLRVYREGSSAGLAFLLAGKNGEVRLWDDLGQLTSPLSFAYVAADHRWLRIREQAGFVYCDTSPDGATWVNKYKLANPFLLHDLRVEIRGGTWTDTAAGTVRVDNYNGGGEPDGAGTSKTCP